MSTVAIPAQLQNFSLSGAGSSIGDTVLNLKSFKSITGTALTMTTFGSIGYGTIEPGNGIQEEQISFSGITQNSDGTAQLTGVKHVEFRTPFTETSGMNTTHPGSVVFIISNTSGFENAIYSYINAAVASGGVPATAAQQGITRLSQDPTVLGTPIAIGINTTYSGTAINSSTNKVIDQAYLPSIPGLVPAGIVSPYAGSSAPSGWVLCDGSSLARSGTYAALFSAIGTSFGSVDGSHFSIPDLRSRSILGVGTTPTKVATFASRSSNVITVTGLTNASNNEFQTGQAVLYTAASGAMTGLTTLTTYYLIRTGNLTFSLASSLANAQNGTAIALSSDGTGTQTFTLTLTTRTLGDTGGEENHAMSSTEILAHTHTQRFAGSGGNSSVSTVSGTSGADPNALSGVTSSAGGNAAMNIINPFVSLNYIIKY